MSGKVAVSGLVGAVHAKDFSYFEVTIDTGSGSSLVLEMDDTALLSVTGHLTELCSATQAHQGITEGYADARILEAEDINARPAVGGGRVVLTARSKNLIHHFTLTIEQTTKLQDDLRQSINHAKRQAKATRQ